MNTWLSSILHFKDIVITRSLGICVCVNVYTCVHVHKCMYMCIHVCAVFKRASACMYVCVHVHTHTPTWRPEVSPMDFSPSVFHSVFISKLYLFLLMCMCACVSLCEPHTCRCLCMSEGIRYPIWNYRWLSHLIWFENWSPLREQ